MTMHPLVSQLRVVSDLVRNEGRSLMVQTNPAASFGGLIDMHGAALALATAMHRSRKREF